MKNQRKQHLHPNDDNEQDDNDKIKNHHHHRNHNHHQHQHHQNHDARHVISATPNNSDWPNTMKNITVTAGRDATFECVFPKLKDFRVSHSLVLCVNEMIIHYLNNDDDYYYSYTTSCSMYLNPVVRQQPGR